MPFFLDPNGNIHQLDDLSHPRALGLLPAGSEPITDEHAAALLNPPLTLEQIAAKLLESVERRMDVVARNRGYNDRYTAALRAAYPGPWQAEGTSFARWMDECYSHLYAVHAQVLAGERDVPTEDELHAELPALQEPPAAGLAAPDRTAT